MITKKRIKQNLLRLVCLYNSRQRELELAIKAQDDQAFRIIRAEIGRIVTRIKVLDRWLQEVKS